MLPPDLPRLGAHLRGFALQLRQIALVAGDATSRSAALHLASDLEWRATCYERLVTPEACDGAAMGFH